MIRSRRPGPCAARVLLAQCMLAMAGAAVARETPDWVERGGNAAAYPRARFLTGYGQGEGRNEALEEAERQEGEDLSIYVRVHQPAWVSASSTCSRTASTSRSSRPGPSTPRR